MSIQFLRNGNTDTYIEEGTLTQNDDIVSALYSGSMTKPILQKKGGIVHLCMIAVTKEEISNDVSVVATLPEGFRPTDEEEIIVNLGKMSGNGWNAYGVGWGRIKASTGEIYIRRSIDSPSGHPLQMAYINTTYFAAE